MKLAFVVMGFGVALILAGVVVRSLAPEPSARALQPVAEAAEAPAPLRYPNEPKVIWVDPNGVAFRVFERPGSCVYTWGDGLTVVPRDYRGC